MKRLKTLHVAWAGFIDSWLFHDTTHRSTARPSRGACSSRGWARRPEDLLVSGSEDRSIRPSA